MKIFLISRTIEVSPKIKNVPIFPQKFFLMFRETNLLIFQDVTYHIRETIMRIIILIAIVIIIIIIIIIIFTET